MALPTDTITQRKLVLTKRLFHHAVVQSNSVHSPVSRIISIIGFDLSSETMLKTVVAGLETTKPPADAFQPLIDQADRLLQANSLGTLPDRTNLQYVHSIRNDAQHKAKYPNETDVGDCRAFTKGFLQSVVQQVWGIDFDCLSMADLVRNTSAKQYLLQAEAEYARGDYQKALDNAAAGLTLVLNRVQRGIVGDPHDPFVKAFVMADQFGRDMKPSTKIYDAFAKIQRTTLFLALGMSLPDYMRFADLAGTTVFTIDGNFHRAGGKLQVGEKDAEIALAYTSSTVVEIEERVGDVERPFGREWFR